MPYSYDSVVIHDNYEVSIWDDVYDTSNQRFTELKVAVIGSNTMTAQTRVIDPTLTENINGTKTLTFSIYYRFIDNFDGEEKINPFIKLLIVERKVKLFWKDEWYDFIIKQRVESSDRHSFIYTCESLAANELTKTGYHLEFDTELANNTDTVWNLAQTVLDGTDWQLADQDGKNFRETIKESGYKVPLEGNTTIDGYSDVLLFYNTLFLAKLSPNATGTIMVQVWVGNLEPSNADSEGVLKNGRCITSVNGMFSKQNNNIYFTFYIENSTYVCIYSNLEIYTYRAKRDILLQLTVFSPPLKRYVGQYTYNDTEILGYTTAEYISPEVVTNLIINDKDFYNTDGWFNADEFTIWPLYDANQSSFDIDTYNPKGYLLASNQHKKIGNNCFLHNTTYIPDGLTKGDKLIVKLKVNKATFNPATGKFRIADPPVSISASASINKYTYNSTTHEYTPLTTSGNVYGSVSLTSSDGYLLGTLTLTKSASRTDLLTLSIALFFNFNTVLQTNEYYAVEEALLYFRKTDINNNIITPNSVDETSVLTYVTKYFSTSDNVPGKTADDIEWLHIGVSHISPEDSYWSEAVPILDLTCEKIRTINGKNSTRYNWLLTLAETFEVWCKFWVVHNPDGTIAYEDNKPKKYVTFIERVGELADYGFIYGIDLRSILRTIDSNALATKVIVPQNSNQYADNGFCTIQRSSENYSKENYILNFDYYADNGLIDRGRLYTDLYELYDAATYDLTGNLGYYPRLNSLNTEYDARVDEIIAIKNDLEKQKVYLNVYTDLRDSTQTEIASINYQITTLVSTDENGEATGYNSSNVEEYMKSNPEWLKLIDLLKTRGELQRAVMSYTSIITSLNASIASLTEQLTTLEEAQELNRATRQEIIDEFNKRYSRYVLEGTWQSEDYIDDTQYYLDGLGVAYTAARPKLTYNILVIRLSALEDFKNKVFKLGDISWVEDEEFFMARYREEVVVTQVVSHLDMPENDSITVLNYRTQFQDLFQRTESTIQSFQYGEGSYNNVASIMESDGTINVVTLLNSIANNNFLMNLSGLNNSITSGPEGITVTDLTDVSKKVRITANGIFITTDGGSNWINAIKGTGISTEALSAGAINVRDIIINGSQGNTFRWDDKGITAYYFDSNTEVINTSHFIRLDRFGLYGLLNYTIPDPSDPTQEILYEYAPTSEDLIFNDASFGMTWNRFFMKNKYGDHYVEVSSTNDIRVVAIDNNVDSERIKIGKLSTNPDIYGIRITDDNANTVMETGSNGTLWLLHILNIGTTSTGNYLVKLGYLPLVSDTNSQIKWGEAPNIINLDTRTITNTQNLIHRTIDVNNKFVVWEDGTMYAKDGYFEGTINATSGHFTGEITATGGTIGNVYIGDSGFNLSNLPTTINNIQDEIGDLKSFEISSDMGYTYTVDDYGASPSTITLNAVAKGFTITDGTSVSWFGSSDMTTWSSLGTGLTKDVAYTSVSAYTTYYIKAQYSNNTDTLTAYTALNLVHDGSTGSADVYVPKITYDTIYRIFKENGGYDISQASYEILLLENDGTILEPDTDYEITISMLPITKNNEQTLTIEQYILSHGYDDLILALTDKITQVNTILTYDTLVYNFNLQNLFTASALIGYEEEIDALKRILGSQAVVFSVNFYLDNNLVGRSLLHLNTWIDENLAAFTNTAVSILAAVNKAGYLFGANGLVITDGNLEILLSDLTDPNNPKIDRVFYVDATSTPPRLVLKGSIYATDGIFNGEVHATSGTFTGEVNATSGIFNGELISELGTIGGFTIGPHTISSDNLILLSSYIDNNTLVPSKITVLNIEIGSGAVIQDYINLGNTARLYGDSEPIKLLVAGLDLSTQAPKITINKDGTMYIGSLTFNGADSTILGDEWTITPSVATFKNIVASGKITSSIFEYNKLQTVGGLMVFRPVFRILDFNEDTNNVGVYNLILDSTFEIENGAIIKLYLTDSDFSDETGITVMTIANNDQGHNAATDYKVTIAPNIDTSQLLLSTYRFAMHFGMVTSETIDSTTTYTISNALLLGINSTISRGLLLPKGITLKEPITGDGNFDPNTYLFNYGETPRVYIGDLTLINNINLALNDYKYGLYSDNVVLNGSLTTKITGSVNLGENESYAGINTNGPVKSNKLPDNKLVVIWAGALNVSAEAIANAPFQVTQDGSLYANAGRFEGSIITNSHIEASALYTSKVYGWENSQDAPLSIYSTLQGINFYNSNGTSDDETDDEITLSITQNGLVAYTIDQDSKLQQHSFITINDGVATFIGNINAAEASSIKLGHFNIINDIILNNDSGTLLINSTELRYYLGGTNNITRFSVTNGLTQINSDLVLMIKDVTYGDGNNKMTYKLVTGGYDLYVG